MRFLSASESWTPGCGASRPVVVLLNANDDHAAGGVGERCHVAAQVPALTVAVAVKDPLEVQVERLRDLRRRKCPNVAGAE